MTAYRPFWTPRGEREPAVQLGLKSDRQRRLAPVADLFVKVWSSNTPRTSRRMRWVSGNLDEALKRSPCLSVFASRKTSGTVSSFPNRRSSPSAISSPAALIAASQSGVCIAQSLPKGSTLKQQTTSASKLLRSFWMILGRGSSFQKFRQDESDGADGSGRSA